MHRRTILAAAIALALDAHGQSIPGSALPTDGRVIRGEASISQSGAAMRIEQSSARAAIDWQSFSVGAQASVQFQQPSASAIVLNRVLGASGSEIFGKLSSNGQVFLTNPNGILFGRGAQVDVGGLLATTLGISPDDFMAGRHVLRGQGTPGTVVNEGRIRAPRGSVALVAPSIVNDGLIEAQQGTVSLAAANAATIEYMADGLVRIRVDEGALLSEITNNGVLRADGGSVILTAKALNNLATAVVNNTGIIEARTVENVNGVVRLGGGDVHVHGTIDASAQDGTGGSIHVLGDRVALLDSALIDASGAHGGGEVRIGGDFGGRNPAVQNAQYTYIGPQAVVRADARTAGDGGRVIVWSDEVTRVYGGISVRGGSSSGDGGFVETSSKGYLDVQQAPDLRAPAGRAGTWLLDPQTIDISTGGNLDITGVSPFQPVLGTLGSVLNIVTLNSALDQGGTVIVDTSVALGLGAGDINVNAPITKSSGSDSTLELRAHNNINVNQDIVSSNNPLTIVFNADQDGQNGGAVNLANNVALNTAGGTIHAASEVVNLAGTATINGVLNVGTLNVSTGTLTAPRDLNVTTALNWSDGQIEGAGRLVTASTATTSIGASPTLSGKVWDNSGTINIDAPNNRLRVVNAATLRNFGQINLTGAASKPIEFVGSNNTLDNAGTITKSSTGTQSIDSNNGVFNNSGLLNVFDGTLSVASTTFTQAGTIDVAAGKIFQRTGGFTNSGTLQGYGTFDAGTGTIMNAGTVAPGRVGAVGTLSVNGNFVQTPGGSVQIDHGSGHDLLSVSGGMTLDGGLTISHLPSFSANAGAVFTPITYVSASGDFAAKSFPVGVDYGTQVTATSYRLTLNSTIAVVPPPKVPPAPPPSTTTASATVGFEPSTVATAGMTSDASAIGAGAGSSAPLVALSVQPSLVLPDISPLLAAMNDLREKKVQAMEEAVRILERDPGMADLPVCAAEVSGNCIAQRPTVLSLREGADKVVPELAHIWGIERKIALVIGVAEYQDPIPRLDSPLKDVAEVTRLYRDQFGYEVRTLTNADKASIVREINRLILETKVNDSVLVFYAGHGHIVEKTGRGYWIPAKANGEDPTQWISNSDIAKMLANIPARQVLLVSDSCYAGTLTREGRMEKSEVLSDPRAVLERRSVTVLSSGGEEPVADAGKDGHSVFAWHFIRTLGRVAQWSSGVEIYERLAEWVPLDFPQQPQYGAVLGAGHEPGADFLFEVRRY